MSWRARGLTAALGLGLGLLVVGVMPFTWLYAPPRSVHADHAAPAERWACPMQCVILDGPGTCPVCGMDLERLAPAGAELELNAYERKMIELRTTEVTARPLRRELRAFGRVDYDERRVRTLTAWVDGRIVRLYADTTYGDLRKGDHVFTLYSPELYAAQTEYLSALRAGGRGASLAASARERLRLFGLEDDQIAALERDGAQLVTEIRASRGGKITRLFVKEGEWVKTGSPVLTIADFDALWLRFDAYERDLPWLVPGQDVAIELEAWPGRRFAGTIETIDDVVDEATRAVKVRVVVDNRERLIKPGMFATVIVAAELTAAGTVAAPSLRGRFTCPMHPEVHDDEAGACPICEMPLEIVPRAAAGQGEVSEAVLSVPRSAVLDTGARQLVYRMVRPPQMEQRDGEWVELSAAAFEAAAVRLGPTAGEHVMVLEGLAAGDRVATRGAMLIDAQMELLGKPSLLQPEGSAGAPADPHAGH